MASLDQKTAAEKRITGLREDAGFSQPDHEEYGFAYIRLYFNSVRQLVIIDIDEPRGRRPRELHVRAQQRRAELLPEDDIARVPRRQLTYLSPGGRRWCKKNAPG
jgi:hypothetical protein